MPSLNLLRTLAVTAGLLLGAGAVPAQGSANKPVSLVVPYPAGGLSDVIARMVERPLAHTIGQTVIVDNVGGAGGAIAA